MSNDKGGYRYCACRDCGEVTMTTGLPEHDFCHGCATAGCELDEDCQAPHAYCEADIRCELEIWACSYGGKRMGPTFEGETARDAAVAWGKEHLATRGTGQGTYPGWGLVQYCGVCGLEF